MCTVSFVGDHFNEKFDPFKKYFTPPGTTGDPITHPFTPGNATVTFTGISREEFEQLKKDVEEMKSLLKRAKLYDEQTGQPDCEMEQKVSFLKQIAEAVGVDLAEVFGPKK